MVPEHCKKTVCITQVKCLDYNLARFNKDAMFYIVIESGVADALLGQRNVLIMPDNTSMSVMQICPTI